MTQPAQETASEAAALAERFCKGRISAEYFKNPDKSALLKELADLGLCGCVIPEEHGGSAVGLAASLAVLETLGRFDPQLAYGVAGINFGIALPIFRHGSPKQKERYLRSLVRCESTGALAHTEPEGAGLSQVRTTARKRAAGYLLDGQKSFISHAGTCDLMLVTARTGDGADPLRNLSVFLVDARSAKGIQVGRAERTVGMPNLEIADVHLEGVEVGAGDLLGEEGGAARLLMESMNYLRLGVSAIAIGGAKRVFAELETYCKLKKIGQTPMFGHPGVRERLSAMLAEVRCAEWLLEGARASHEGPDPMRAMTDSIVCKARVTSQVRALCESASELMGAAGYMDDDIVERLQRDLRVLTLLAGPNQSLMSLLSDFCLPLNSRN